MDKQAKEIREHVARAKAYASKFETLKALASAAEAVKGLALGKAVGRDRFEIEILLAEVLRALSRADEVKRIHRKDIALAKGQEKRLYVLLVDLIKRITEARNQEMEAAARARKNKLDQIVLKAQELLDSRQFMDAKKVMRLAAEQFGDEPGLFTDLGTRMVTAGCFNEAIEFLERAIELNPKDSRPYGYLTRAYEQAGRLQDAERLLRDALKQFGRNARIFGLLAKLCKEARRWNEAYEMARSAVDMDPSMQDCKKILVEMEKRIFGSQMSA